MTKTEARKLAWKRLAAGFRDSGSTPLGRQLTVTCWRCRNEVSASSPVVVPTREVRKVLRERLTDHLHTDCDAKE